MATNHYDIGTVFDGEQTRDVVFVEANPHSMTNDPGVARGSLQHGYRHVRPYPRAGRCHFRNLRTYRYGFTGTSPTTPNSSRDTSPRYRSKRGWSGRWRGIGTRRIGDLE